MVFPAEALTQVRQEHDMLLPDTCTIQRPSSSDQPLGKTTTWADHQTGVPCRLDDLGSFNSLTVQQQQLVGALTNDKVFVLELPALTDVTLNDRLKVNTPGNTNRLMIIRWITGRTSWETGVQIMVSEGRA